MRRCVTPPSRCATSWPPCNRWAKSSGPLLIQLAPWCGIDQLADFRTFLAALPRGPQYAVEFRNAGWRKQAVYDALRESNVALVALDHEEHPEQAELIPTADFLYVRLVGKHGRYDTEEAERYDPTDLLRVWLEKIRAVEAEQGPSETGSCAATTTRAMLRRRCGGSQHWPAWPCRSRRRSPGKQRCLATINRRRPTVAAKGDSGTT